MTAPGELADRWGAVLDGGAELAADWGREIAALPHAERRALCVALRAAVDRAVRTSPPVALVLSERLLVASEGLSDLGAAAQRGRAVALHANGRSAEAIGPYLAARAAHERAGEELEVARVERSLVDVYQMAGDPEAALAVAARARERLQRLGEQRLLAQLECNVGNVHFRLDEYPRARVCYSRAIELFASLGDSFGRAYAVYNLANIQTNAGEFEAARGAYQDARAAFEQGGHLVYAADSRYSLAYLDFRCGRFAEAILGLEGAREQYEQGGKPSGAPLCSMDLAEVHLDLGAYRDALRFARAGEERFAALSMDYEAAKCSLFEAVAAARLGLSVEADRAFDRAEGRLDRLGNRVKGALVRLQRAQWAARRAPSLQSLGRARAALSELERGGDEWLVRLGHLVVAELCLGLGDGDGAERALRPTLEPSRSDARERAVEIDGRALLADVHERRGESEAARAQLQRAAEAVQSAYAELGERDARLAFFRDRQAIFARLALLELRANPSDPLTPLALVETSRQRSLEESPLAPPGDDPSLRALWERMRGLGSLLGEERPGPGAYRAGPAASELGTLEAQWMELWRERRRRQSAAPKVHLDTRELLQSALPPTADVVYFIEGGRGFASLRRRGGEWSARVLSMDSAGAEDWHRRWRLQTEKWRLGGTYSTRHGGRLVDIRRQLLAELGTRLGLDEWEGTGNGPLWIVPYGRLHHLPLHGALVGGQYLCQQRAVNYARSLRQLLKAKAQVTRWERAVFSGGAGLPAVDAEREALARCFGARFEVVLPADLSARLSRPHSPPGLLHLAGHGSYRPDHPLFSGVDFGTHSLSSLELQGMQVAGATVVLSGCETGRNGVSRGEELFGPEQALFAAGARAVVSSLWPVEDGAAARLMARWAEDFAAGQSACAALHAARAELLATEPSDPSHLAWVIAGDGEATWPTIPSPRAVGSTR